MSSLTITRGLPGSGKSTWAKAWVAVKPDERARVNRDDIRVMLFGTDRGLSWKQECAVTEASRASVKGLLKAGCDVVADDMNLRPRYVREWAKLAAFAGAEVHVVEFPMSVDDAVSSDAQRPRPIGEQAIRHLAGKYLQKGHLIPLTDEAVPDEPVLYETPVGGRPAVVVDVDGTLALMDGRSPYDLTLVSTDKPNPAVVSVVNAARLAGLTVVFCSGREDSARVDTETWLKDHAGRLPSEPVFMRAAGDGRRDSIVKRELFDTHIRNVYAVRYVLDDRQQVVDMWRSLGLTCLQVAPGDF